MKQCRLVFAAINSQSATFCCTWSRTTDELLSLFVFMEPLTTIGILDRPVQYQQGFEQEPMCIIGDIHISMQVKSEPQKIGG